jgi:very-short-patch-repair endonuclease
VAGHPGSAKIAGFLDLADGRRESPGETRLGHLFHLMRTSVTPQFEISEPGVRAVVDFRLDGEMVVVEFDGLVKYGRTAAEPDPFGNRRTPNQVLVAEKRREDAIRELGYEVVRVVWSDLDDPLALARRIAAAVRRARRRHGRSAA